MHVVICPNCGAQIREKTSTCPFCGVKINDFTTEKKLSHNYNVKVKEKSIPNKNVQDTVLKDLGKKTSEERSLTIRDVLFGFVKNNKHIKACILAKHNGSVVDFVSDSNITAEKLGTASYALILVGSKVLQKISNDNFNYLILSGENDVIVLKGLNPNLLLTVYAEKEVNIGLVLLGLEQLAKKLLNLVKQTGFHS